jgi:hypothetical protein
LMTEAELIRRTAAVMLRLPQQAQQRQQAINALLRGRAAVGGPVKATPTTPKP